MTDIEEEQEEQHWPPWATLLLLAGFIALLLSIAWLAVVRPYRGHSGSHHYDATYVPTGTLE
jgi:hypothetical protein